VKILKTGRKTFFDKF